MKPGIFSKYYILIATIVVYLFAVWVIYPVGNYPVNDDWDFILHVKYFSEGKFVKNSLIDASFILQGFLGLLWSNIFGLSFDSLRILTIIFFIIFLIGFNKILVLFNLNNKVKLLSNAALLINPYTISSSLSFMTEIYFLSFMVWSLFFFFKYSDNQNKTNFYLAITLASASILIRQFGILLLITYALYFIFIEKKSKNKNLLIIAAGLLIPFSINFIFPIVGTNFNSSFEKLTSLFGGFKEIIYEIVSTPLYLTYLSLTFAPLILSIRTTTPIKKLSYLLIIPLSYLIFITDIFNLRNVFHAECYFCESNFKHSLNLVDNVIFKGLLSALLSFLIFKSFHIIKFKNFSKKDLQDKYIFITSVLIILTYCAILISESFYDRYFLNIEVLLIILFAYVFKNQIKLNLATLIISISLFIYILFLNIEFHNSIKIKFEQTLMLHQKTGFKSSISTHGSISRYLSSKDVNPEELDNVLNYGKVKCYVIRNVKGGESFDKFFNSRFLNNKYLRNPTFKHANNFTEIPKIEKFQNNIIYRKEYFSPIYNVFDKKVYIISFCTDEAILDQNLEVLK